MNKNFKDIFNDYDIEPPKGLKQAVFERIEMEKDKSVARKKLLLDAGFVVSGASSFAAVFFLGKEIVSSEFFSLASLMFSDMKTVAMLWQDYTLSLLETLPTVSIATTLLPVFVFMILLRQYGKLENYNYSLKH
jgi:hypothetical protein